MRKKRLFALSLMIGLSASFITLQVNSTIKASSQDEKVKSPQEKAPLSLKPQALLDCSIISPLDSRIQDRFAQSGRGFGIERVMIRGRGLHTPIPSFGSYSQPMTIGSYSQPKTIGSFVPENDQEKEAVAEIERSGLNMALYLASRNILGTESDESQNRGGQMLIGHPMMHAPLRGPVAITQGSQTTDWPEKSSLWKQARKAMHNFDGDKSASQYEFSVEGKDFIARPVRAQESCLQCHNPPPHLSNTPNSGGLTRRLSVGDPLGVLLYAYTTSAKSNNVKIP